jgi:hypothetical protein
MTEPGLCGGDARSHFLKPIFYKWEKLRLPYNIILAVILWLSHGISLKWQFFQPMFLSIWLAGGIGANLCFFVGPLVESYLTWLGLCRRWVTFVIFVIGVFISLPCVLLFPFAFWPILPH